MEATPFKFIFVLFAGAAIFILIILFGQNIITPAIQRESNFEVRDKFEEQIDALLMSNAAGRDVTFNFPFKIETKCLKANNRLYYNFLLKNTDRKADGATKNVIFMDNNIETNRFSIWAVTWRFPYPIATFYFVKDMNKKFCIQTTDKSYFSDFDYAALNISLNLFIKENCDSDDYDRVLVYDGSYSGNKEYVKVDKKRHVATFFRGGKKIYEGYYYDATSLVAVLFTNDKVVYDCSMANAIDYFSLITSIYIQKARGMQNLGILGSCNYQGLINTLTGFKESRDITTKIKTSQELESLQNIITGRNCAHVF